MSRSASAASLLLVLSACARTGTPVVPASTPAPDIGKRVVAERGAVTSAHPRASEAGLEILRRGGNAVDAAVATAFAVSVGEPQMSGLGGGGAMLVWLQGRGRAEYLDFYAAQRAASFRGLSRSDSGRTDLRVVGVPGYVAGLLAAHERYGRLSRADVMAPAIRLAEDGFAINQILAQMIAMDSAKLARYPDSRRVFLPGDKPLRAGEILRQPELATSLRRVAEQGRDGFYRGPIADSLVRTLNAGGHPASIADLASFAPQWKRPLCGAYRGAVILSAAPPQTGAQVIETLELLEPHALPALGLPTRSARAFDVLTSALRVGLADNRYIEDPNWTATPVTGMISPAYAGTRRAMVGAGRAAAQLEPGSPIIFTRAEPPRECAPLEPFSGAAAGAPGATDDTQAPAPAPAPAGGETTHISVVDEEGNAVALTQTNSSTFGVGARSLGFFLNDSGIDFSRRAQGDSTVSGRSEWRVRRTTIAPTIVLRGGRVQMVVGAPGGGRIPTEIVQTMVYVLDYGMDPLEALRMPRIFPSAGSPRVELENGFDAQVLAEARRMGYEPVAQSFGYARLYMIARRGDRWIAVADPRHNGEARGY